MKIAGYKRVRKEDFPQEFQSVIESLSGTINDGIEQINTALQGRLDFKNNFYGDTKEIDIEVDSSGIPVSETVILKSFSTKTQGMQVVQATNLTNSSVYPTAAPFITFTDRQTGVLINHIAGLPANNIFRLKVEIKG